VKTLCLYHLGGCLKRAKRAGARNIINNMARHAPSKIIQDSEGCTLTTNIELPSILSPKLGAPSLSPATLSLNNNLSRSCVLVFHTIPRHLCVLLWVPQSASLTIHAWVGYCTIWINSAPSRTCRIRRFDSLASWPWHIWNFRPICLELIITSAAQPCFINKNRMAEQLSGEKFFLASIHFWGNLNGPWHCRDTWVRDAWPTWYKEVYSTRDNLLLKLALFVPLFILI